MLRIVFLMGCLLVVGLVPIDYGRAASQTLTNELVRVAQADKAAKQERKAKKQAEKQRRRAQRNRRGPDRANRQRRREMREQQQQRKALQQQRQRQKAQRGEKHRRRTIDADRQRQQQLRQERQRQRALREERQRQRAARKQQKQQRADRNAQRRERELRQRRREQNRRRARRERRENIVRQNDRHTVRTRKRIDRRGRVHHATTRHHRVRDRRHRNRYRNGFSIFFLPPLGVNIARDRYYLYGSQASYDDYVDLFEAPPVVNVSRRYTMDEIVENPEVRAMVRSVDIDMINFASGSAIITEDQFYKLDDLANAMLEVLQKNQYEKFLIEGYTDATGDDEANLLLSEERAAAVQSALIERYGIPSDNLEAVGYGEQYLLVQSQGSELRNRRVTIRAVGDLLAGNN